MKKRSGMKGLILLGAVCLSAACAWADVKLMPAKATRDIIVLEDNGTATSDLLKIEELYRMDFNSTLTTNKTAEGDVCKIGDKLEVTFTSEKDCYLTLLDFTPSGKIIVLFPNEWAKDNAVKANTPVKIPAEGAKFTMKSSGPAGTDVIKAVATLQKEEVFDINSQKLAGPFAVLDVNARAMVMRDIIITADQETPSTPTAPTAPTTPPNPSTPTSTEPPTNNTPVTPPADSKVDMSVPSLAVHTKDEATDRGAFCVTTKSDWTIKTWAEKDTFKDGDKIMLAFQTNKPCTILSITNKGSSGQENKLLPEGQTPKLKAEAINLLPSKNDSWVFKATGPAGSDTLVAQVKRDDKDETVDVTFTLKVQ